MDEPTTPPVALPERKPSSAWAAASLACIVSVAVTAGAVSMLRAELRMQAEHTAQMREKTLGPVNEQLQELFQRLNALGSPRDAQVDQAALQQELASTKAALATLTARLEMLEQKPAPVLVMPAPTPPPVETYAVLRTTALSGAPYAEALRNWGNDHPQGVPSVDALRPFAETGIPTESALRAQLRAAIPAPSTPNQPEMADAINTRLAGLISIRKQGEADVYAPLRASTPLTDIPSLIAAVDALPEAKRAPLTAWRDTAQARLSALAALEALASITPTKTSAP